MNGTHREIMRELLEQEGQRIRPPEEYGGLKLWRFDLPTTHRSQRVQKGVIQEMLLRGLVWYDDMNGNDIVASEYGEALYRKGQR